MNEFLPPTTEESEIDTQSVIDIVKDRILIEPADPVNSPGHFEIKIDDHDELWLSAIKGQDEEIHLLEVKVYSMKPDNNEVRILGLIDFLDNKVTDEHGQALSQERLYDLKDCLELFPEN